MHYRIYQKGAFPLIVARAAIDKLLGLDDANWMRRLTEKYAKMMKVTETQSTQVYARRISGTDSQISLLMEIDNSELITELRTTSANMLREMVERDKQRGLIKPEIDPDLVVEMIYTFFVREYFWIGMAEEKFLKRINDAIKIIKEGIAKV